MKTRAQRQDDLHQLILDKVSEVVTEVKELSFTEDYDATVHEAFGIMMSHYFGWDGYQIMKAAAEALENANFHDEASELQGMIANKEYYSEKN